MIERNGHHAGDTGRIEIGGGGELPEICIDGQDAAIGEIDGVNEIASGVGLDFATLEIHARCGKASRSLHHDRGGTVYRGQAVALDDNIESQRRAHGNVTRKLNAEWSGCGDRLLRQQRAE